MYVLSNHYENISKKSLTNDFKCGMRVSMNGSANAVQKEVLQDNSISSQPTSFPWGKHPNSLKNLIPTQPGEVRNPNGRRPTSYYIDKLMPADKRAERLVSLATQEDQLGVALSATKEVMDRVDGPVKQLIDVRKTQITLDVDSLDELAYLAGTLQSEPIEITKDSENGVQNVNYQTLGENVSQSSAPADSVPSPIAGDGDSHDS